MINAPATWGDKEIFHLDKQRANFTYKISNQISKIPEKGFNRGELHWMLQQ
jgi:hypothetical protein